MPEGLVIQGINIGLLSDEQRAEYRRPEDLLKLPRNVYWRAALVEPSTVLTLFSVVAYYEPRPDDLIVPAYDIFGRGLDWKGHPTYKIGCKPANYVRVGRGEIAPIAVGPTGTARPDKDQRIYLIHPTAYREVCKFVRKADPTL